MERKNAKHLTNLLKQPNSQKYKYSLFALIGVIFLAGCQKVEKQSNEAYLIDNYPYLESEINQLKIKLSEIENLITVENTKNKSLKLKDESNEIKSITFRIGSQDDRIRIYWTNGRKTDLPCTKEQSIWACG